MKPKDYLVSIGAIKSAGRGRMSLEHKALIEDAVSKGIHIDGYSISTPAPNAPVVKEVTKTPKPQSDKIPLNPLFRYPQNAKVIDAQGKTHSIKAVCQNSGYSIIGCTRCDSVHRIVHPSATMSINVTVERA